MIKNWHPFVRSFKSPRLLQVIFEIIDLQGDGEIRLVIGLIYRSIMITLPFPGDKIKTRLSWTLFKRRPPIRN